jgi:hypothetical protein
VRTEHCEHPSWAIVYPEAMDMDAAAAFSDQIIDGEMPPGVALDHGASVEIYECSWCENPEARDARNEAFMPLPAPSRWPDVLAAALGACLWLTALALLAWLVVR